MDEQLFKNVPKEDRVQFSDSDTEDVLANGAEGGYDGPRGESLRDRRNQSSNQSLPTLSHLYIPTTAGTVCLNSADSTINQRNRSTPEEVVREGQELFQNFIREEIDAAHLQPPEEFISMTNSVSSADTERSMRSPATCIYLNENRNVGTRLRAIAEEFERTSFRSDIRREAEQLDLAGLTAETFTQLLTHYWAGGISLVKIIVIFTFCRDVIVRTLQLMETRLFGNIMRWALEFLANYICKWVQDQGGWDAVLWKASDFVHDNLMVLALILGVLAIAGFFIWRQFYRRFF